VIRKIALALVIVSLLPSSSAIAEEEVGADVKSPRFADNLISTFDAVCLRNRGSWEGMKQAAESSPLGFRPVGDAKGRTQADYLAFPVTVSLKRFGRSYACIVQSLVENEATEDQLASRLIAEGQGLNGVIFAREKSGVFGPIQGSGRGTGAGTFYTTVRIRVTDGPIENTKIAHLALTN